MTDDLELDRAVDARLAAFRPGQVPPFAALQARRRRRDVRRGAAAVVGVLAVGGAAFLPGAPSPGLVARGDASFRPPERIVVEGMEFLRRGTEPLVLHPGVRPDDASGVFATVPRTHVPSGECAVHYEPVVASQTSDEVVLATWRYTPEQKSEVLSCDAIGRGDRTARLQLDEPLDDRALRIEGRPSESSVLLLDRTGAAVPFGLAPVDAKPAEVCLEQRCVTVTDEPLLRMVAETLNRAVRVRAGDPCSDAGRTDGVDRTYLVRFGSTGLQVEVPLGCAPLHVVGSKQEYALDAGGPDVVRIAYDQQISPENMCLGIGGPSGGPESKGYVGLTLEEAERRAIATNNDVLRVAGRDGVCTGIVRDHVINRVNVYLEDGIVVAAHSF